jgi:hypothetical protein
LVGAVAAIAAFAAFGGVADGGEAQAAPAGCHVTGKLAVQYDWQHPYRVAERLVGPNCEITDSVRDVSPEEFSALTSDSGGASRSPLTAHSDRVEGTYRVEHAQIKMAQVDSYATWGWDTSSVVNYSDGYVYASTGGCGWSITDGPYAWWEPADMPYEIYLYGWASFESACNPADRGWLEPAAWGDYDGNWGVVCDQDFYAPIGSSYQCFATLIF